MRLLSICFLFALLAISLAMPYDFEETADAESAPLARSKRQWGYGGGWGRPGWGGGGWGRPGWGGGWGRPGWGGGGWGRPWGGGMGWGK